MCWGQARYAQLAARKGVEDGAQDVQAQLVDAKQKLQQLQASLEKVLQPCTLHSSALWPWCGSAPWPIAGVRAQLPQPGCLCLSSAALPIDSALPTDALTETL